MSSNYFNFGATMSSRLTCKPLLSACFAGTETVPVEPARNGLRGLQQVEPRKTDGLEMYLAESIRTGLPSPRPAHADPAVSLTSLVIPGDAD